MMKTKNCISSAGICRANGWNAGMRLIGNEGYGDTIIEITAIGEKSILAKRISHKGILYDHPYENLWTLQDRDWTKIS